jgi:hypothetical protein
MRQAVKSMELSALCLPPYQAANKHAHGLSAAEACAVLGLVSLAKKTTCFGCVYMTSRDRIDDGLERKALLRMVE